LTTKRRSRKIEIGEGKQPYSARFAERAGGYRGRG